MQDSEGLQLPLFAFPSGMSLSLVRADVFPAPSPCSFFSFVCTDEHGKHFYVACLQFMEELLPADVLALLHEVYGSGEVRAKGRPLITLSTDHHSLIITHPLY